MVAGCAASGFQSVSPGTSRFIQQSEAANDKVGVCASPWGKRLGDGLFEFRVRLTGRQMLCEGWASPGSIDASERILLRVFCHAYGERLILLLGGYDKGSAPAKSRQASEIAIARARLRRHRASLAAQDKTRKRKR